MERVCALCVFDGMTWDESKAHNPCIHDERARDAAMNDKESGIDYVALSGFLQSDNVNNVTIAKTPTIADVVLELQAIKGLLSELLNQFRFRGFVVNTPWPAPQPMPYTPPTPYIGPSYPTWPNTNPQITCQHEV